MEIKYNINVSDGAYNKNLVRLLNQTYKLLPSREEGIDWQKSLANIIEEFAGMDRLMIDYKQDIFFSLLCKLEGLYTLTNEEDFSLFRSTIFECINLIGGLKNDSVR
jgi:hypothetical protein